MGMCISPNIFGPYFWTVIHISCLTSNNKEGLGRFIETLPDIIPCLHCSEHLKENLKTLPFDPTDPFRWSVQLHNNVNRDLNKPVITYDDALVYWNNKCIAKETTIDPVLILVGILFGIGIVFR